MTFLVDKMSPNLFSNKIPNQPAHLKLSVCLHSVETLGMRKVVSSQGDNYAPAPPSKNTPMCIVTPPTTIFVIICFQLCPALSFMARSPLQHVGTETLEMFFRPFCPPSSNHLAKLRTTKLGHFWVKAVCLFVLLLLALTNADHLSEFSGKPRKIESIKVTIVCFLIFHILFSQYKKLIIRRLNQLK